MSYDLDSDVSFKPSWLVPCECPSHRPDPDDGLGMYYDVRTSRGCSECGRWLCPRCRGGRSDEWCDDCERYFREHPEERPDYVQPGAKTTEASDAA